MQSLDSLLDAVDPKVNVKASLPPESQATARKNVVAALKELVEAGIDCYRSEPAIIDCDGSKFHYNVGYSPCLTASRGRGGHWVSSRGRRQSVAERLRLMGVRPQRVEDAVKNEPANLIGEIIGNAVPVPLLAAVYRSLLPAIGFTVAPRRR